MVKFWIKLQKLWKKMIKILKNGQNFWKNGQKFLEKWSKFWKIWVLKFTIIINPNLPIHYLQDKFTADNPNLATNLLYPFISIACPIGPYHQGKQEQSLTGSTITLRWQTMLRHPLLVSPASSWSAESWARETNARKPQALFDLRSFAYCALVDASKKMQNEQ